MKSCVPHSHSPDKDRSWQGAADSAGGGMGQFLEEEVLVEGTVGKKPRGSYQLSMAVKQST